MTDINWAAAVDDALYDAHELEERQRIRDVLAAREGAQREAAQLEREQEREHTQQPARVHSAPPQSAASTYVVPVDMLAAALAAAPDDAARARLLASASRELRESFRASLIYKAMCDDDPPDIYAEFSARLDAAASDDERRAIIEATEKAFLAEWRWRRTAGPDDWARRFMARANPTPDY